jgi:hypothetical protein
MNAPWISQSESQGGSAGPSIVERLTSVRCGAAGSARLYFTQNRTCGILLPPVTDQPPLARGNTVASRLQSQWCNGGAAWQRRQRRGPGPQPTSALPTLRCLKRRGEIP